MGWYLHRVVCRAGHDAWHFHQASGSRGRDVQPRRPRPQRRWHVYRDSPQPAMTLKRVAVVASIPLAAMLGLAVWVALPLPDTLLAPGRSLAVTLEDRNGLMLRSTRADDGTRSTWVPYDVIDP